MKTIWIDLDNTPHVPFFRPIINELGRRGYDVKITARDAYQVYELADYYALKYDRVGQHYGKNKVMKVAGSLIRAAQLALHVRGERPAIAVSHGSRPSTIAARLLGIPSVSILDYEYAKGLFFFQPTHVLVPDVIPDEALADRKVVHKYRGIKEEVYVPDFTPDPAIRSELGISDDCLLVTVRPPATEAHYHSHKSQEVFESVMDYLGAQDDLRIVLLPRNKRQEEFVVGRWPKLIQEKKVIIPDHAVDGLNLIWYSDFVISGGGTMNREAAALGVPVYSIFQSQIGAVDKYLGETGRLIFLESAEDFPIKVDLSRRDKGHSALQTKKTVLMEIVDKIVDAAEARW
jgi:uncharacterized protein